MPWIRPLRLLTTPGGPALLILAHLIALGQASSTVPTAEPAAQEARTSVGIERCSTDDSLSEADWAGIRAARDASRYEVRSFEGGLRAHNPGQAWSSSFDGRSFLTLPESGSWTWGLQLLGYGFPGARASLTRPLAVSSGGGRVAYDWDEILSEWFVNDARGLEHGFTLRERPGREGSRSTAPGASRPLTLTLAVRGELSPEVRADGTGVRFLDHRGALALTYDGLIAFDREGTRLPARFLRTAEGLSLEVDERDALYPITIDPVAQQAYLKASNTDAGDLLGVAVAVSGDTVVIGAQGEDSAATGVNGLESDDSAPDAGAAYVFVRNGPYWVQEAYLKASNAEAGDQFGASVAIWGDTIVVGATIESSKADGVNGDQSDNSQFRAGAAYVFVRNANTWTQEAYLKASNSGANDQFGNALAISGETLIVGAFAEDSAADGVDGNQANNDANTAGAAYVFVRSGSTWTQEAYLKASNSDGDDVFGWSVGLSGDTAIVGAYMEDSNSTGVNGFQGDNSAGIAGAAYVFARSGTTWTQEAYLKASNTNPGDWFGFAVDVSGDTVVVGAPYEDSNATGVQSNQADNSMPSAGSAYVFTRVGTSWSQEAYLKASNSGVRDHFGDRVALSGDVLLISSPDEESHATGVNGDASDDSLGFAGAAYTFLRSGTTWSAGDYLKASNTGEGDLFGWSVALDGSTAVIGAPGESSPAVGVDGDQADDSAVQAGAAYVLNLDADLAGGAFCFGDGSGAPCPCLDYGGPGAGCRNSGLSGARLIGTGTPDGSNDTLVLSVSGSPPNKVGLLAQGDVVLGAGQGLPVGNGLLCLNTHKRWFVQAANAGGGVAYGPALLGTHAAATPGATLVYQWWYRDDADPCGGGFNFSNAWALTWQ